ncbi:MAG: DNA-processing protein DprA [Candidatus Pacebacteria bacterium]|nr:DNA-processing protein DprA [Candidatus Paceibacterota bacterium]NUQ57280.1 DNA-protecting protein DprA [Candidatus Paceibacter sp.]
MQRKILKPKNFPYLLKQISDPPKELYQIGELPPEDALYLAVVGSRKFSNYGKETCEKIIGGLKNNQRKVVIVSGLAIGIDGIAHKAAVENNLTTIAIPGSGLDEKVLHPRSNVKLSRQIIESGGCLLSELPWEMPAGIHTFPSRNRIIAGLCHGVLVIEAAEKSGTLITAKLALDYGRDVFAVPGSIFSENSKGTNNLIKEGAALVRRGEDILEFYDIKKADSRENKQESLDLEFLSPEEQKLYLVLTEPTAKDELIRKSGLPPAKANSAISMMLLNGVIKQSGGEVYRA